MSTSVNPHARLIFKEAFDKLKDTIDSINPEHTLVFQNTNLENVRNASREIEKALAKRNCLRNMRRILPFLQKLDHYSKSIEVLCNGTPYLPWIWAPVKFVLQIASEFPAALEKLISTYSKIAEVMPRFDRFSEAFRKDLNLHRVMAMAYADILDFHRESYCFFSRPGWRIFFSTLWGKADRRFKVILDSLAENCRLVEIEATTADIVEASSFRVKMEDEIRREDQERAVARLQASLTWLDSQDGLQESELDRLYSRTHEHSCDWIQLQKEAKTWLRIRGSQPVLWLFGKPGAGKSTLSATIIQFLLRDQQSTVLYYFCSYKSSDSYNSSHILRTLIAELLRDNNEMASYIFEEHITNGHAPSIPRLKQLLQTLLSAVPSTRIIIDGIDEIEDGHRSQVLGDVLGLATVQNPSNTCKILVSSQNIPSISRVMSQYPTLDLGKERRSIDTSIVSFIRYELSRVHGGFGQALEADRRVIQGVEQELIEKAEGMFLWVRLVMYALQNSSNIFELRRTVDELPKGIDQMYSRILDRIAKELGQHKWKAVKTILAWMVYSSRNMKRFELLSAISLRLGSGSVGYYAYEWEWALYTCKPLLEETKSGTVTFTHSTVHEYFTKGTGVVTLEPSEANLEICLGSLSCLTHGLDILHRKWTPEKRFLEVAGGRYALISYSTDFWLENILGSSIQMKEGKDVDALVEAIDELHDKHDMIKEFFAPRKAKLTSDVELPHESMLFAKLLKLPHLREMIVDHLHFETSLKKQQFTKGSEIIAFRIEHDPTHFSSLLQRYQDITLEIMHASIDGSMQTCLDRFKQQFTPYVYSCRFRGCGEYLSTIKGLEDHEILHLGGIKCTEPLCSFSRIGFVSAMAFRRHMLRYHPPKANAVAVTSVRRRYVCSGFVDGVTWGCQKRFAVERELQRHIASRKGTICDQRQCKIWERLKIREQQSLGPGPALDGTIEDEELSIIKCICGYDDDDGSTVLCEKCDMWQHIVCYYDSVHAVSDIHECVDCLPRLIDAERAAEKQRQHRELRSIGKGKGRRLRQGI